LNVLVDSTVWSLALRRGTRREDPVVDELAELIRETRAEIIGAVRQEVLSGVRTQEQFERLRDTLRAFPDLELATGDFERAAECFTVCRRHGVQGSNTDFLLCAVAERHGLAILSTDHDFGLFARHLPVTLHEPRASA
jgi:predicted nucleic acid-binding protein